jgi:RimJ/RimL family protein N-acetyltransferase
MGVSALAYRIETPRLVLRCWEPDDAPLLKDAVDSSIEHLLPWMPWARYEPQSLDEKLQLLREFRGQFDLGEQYVYGILEPDESRALGGCGLHPRGGDGSLEIGYWIRADAIGHGLATEAAAVLDRVDLGVDPENERSRKIPVKLGFVEEGLLRRRLPPKTDGGPRRDQLMFSLLGEELAASPCLGFEYVAYDALGRQL